MKKKVMALALSAVMALSTVPWEASAAEPRPDPGEEIVVVEDTGEVSDTAEAGEEPGAVEMPEAEAPADDVILDESVEIAGIEEVAEADVPEEVSIIAEEEAAGADLELMPEDAGMAVEGDADKTDDTAYGDTKNRGRLSVTFKDIAEENKDIDPVTVVDGISKQATPVTDGGNRKYYRIVTDQEAIYDPTDDLPKLELTWTDEAGVTTSLKDDDYSYQRIEGGNVGTAVIQINFSDEYAGIKPLRLQYTIVKKNLQQDDSSKVQVDINSVWKYYKSNDTYHRTYDGTEKPMIDGVTYKGKDLKLTTTAVTTGDWYTVAVDETTVASENKKEGPYGKDEHKNHAKGDEGARYYELTLEGRGNYKGTIIYKFVIDQKEVQAGDITGLDKDTFYVDLDEKEVAKRIEDSLVFMDSDGNEHKLKDIEPSWHPEYVDAGYPGYEIYYYKRVAGGYELFTSAEFPNAWGADAEGKSAPGQMWDNNLRDWVGLSEIANQTDKIKYIAATIGEYKYRIAFTGTGNFVEKKEDVAPIIEGTFRIVDDSPSLADVYASIEDELVKALNDTLNPIYDATDWLVRDGGSVEKPNDVTEMVKNIFNTYTYTKYEDGKPVEYKAGDNVKVSLKPGQSEDGKMIDAKSYVLRLEGIKDWDGQPYIDMDESGNMTMVEQRHLDWDSANDNTPTTIQDLVDYDGSRSSDRGGYSDRFYVANGGKTSTDAKQYEADTRDENDDVYKYGAIWYNTTYKGISYDKVDVTLTHLVRDTEDTAKVEKNYPLAKKQNGDPLTIESVYGDVAAREKTLEEHTDFEVVSKSKDWTVIRGINNYTGQIRVPTLQKSQINLSDADRVVVKVKSIVDPATLDPDQINYTNTEYSLEENGGLDLTYSEGGGVDVQKDNVVVRLMSSDKKSSVVIDPLEYQVVIDENGMCRRCKDITGTGVGRHMHVGTHEVTIAALNGGCARFQKVEFYISGTNFGDDYTAELEDYKAPYVGQKLEKGKAPYNFVKVYKNNNVILGPADYEFDSYCYISESLKKKLTNEDGTLDLTKLEPADLKDLAPEQKINVREEIEFQQAGTWVLVIRPVNTTGTHVEEYEGYVYCAFTVDPKPFVEKAEDGSQRIKTSWKDNNVFTWPGQPITGKEIADRLVVEDVEKLMNTALEYGKDYTIDAPVDMVKEITLRGKGNYAGEITLPITVNPASLEGASVKVKDGAFIYKGSAYTKEDKIDSSSVEVTVVVDDRELPVPEEDYTVTAESKDGGKDAETVVTVTVTGKNHYTGSPAAEVTGKIEPADLSNEANFEVEGVVSPKLYEGEGVEVKQDDTALKLKDIRGEGTYVDISSVTYENNKNVGTATVTVKAADETNYVNAAKATYEIIDPKVGGVELNNEGKFTYQGEALTIEDVIKAVYGENGETLEKYEAKFGGSYPNAGTATVVVTVQTAAGPVDFEKSFTIEPLELTEENVALAETAYTYTGSKITPAVTVTVNEEALTEGTDYSVVPAEDVNAGEVTAAVKGTGNYAGEVPVTFTIAPADISSAGRFDFHAEDTEYSNGGELIETDFVLTDRNTGEEVAVKDPVYSGNDKAGTATVTVTADDPNYTGSATAEFKIAPLTITDADVTLEETTYEYTGSVVRPTVTVTVNGKTLAEGPDYNLSYTEKADVGEMEVGLEGLHNYTGSVVKTFTVTPADISDTGRFQLGGIADKVYVEGTPAVQEDLKLVDMRTGAEIAVKEVRYENNDKPGTATVTVTPDDAKYTGEAKAEFEIVEPGLGNVELKAGPFMYTGKAYTAADVIDAVYRDNGTKTEKYTAAFKEADVTNVGTKTLVVTVETAKGAKSVEKSFEILPVQITDSGVTGVAESYVYDGTVKRPAVTVAADGKKLVQNEDYVVYNTESAEVGTKELAVQGIGNYAGNVLKKFTVTPATIEGAGVTGVKAGYKYNGTVRVPNVKVTAGGRVLGKDADYVVKATESAEIGAKQLVIEGTGNYTGSLTANFTVAPAKAVVADVSAAKAKKLTVTAEEQSGASYQIQYRVQGKNGWTSVKSAKAEKVLKGLKSGKKYEIRVRAYAEINGERVNGKWSKVTVSKKVK